MIEEASRRLFEAGVFGSKILLIILLLIFSFINADVSFLKDKPRMFLFETIVVGLSAAVPFIFIAMNRGKGFGDAASLGVTAFFVFFLFHIVMEFSGQNKASEDLTSKEKKQQDVIKKIIKSKAVTYIALFIVVFMLLMALLIRDIGPGIGVITREALFMALCGALPVVMIARDRGEKDHVKVFKDFMIHFGLFLAGHTALQLGGFYTHLFMPKLNELKT